MVHPDAASNMSSSTKDPNFLKFDAATTWNKHNKPIRAGPAGRKANPFDMGSGFVRPKQVLDPGLVYDGTPSDYKAFLCSIGYSDRKLQMITRDNSTCGSKASSSALNYPSITVPNLKSSFSVSRTVMNVGRPRSIYKAVVYSPAGINVTVVPKRLAFYRYGQKISFTVKFEAVAPTKDYVFGLLSWRSWRSWVSTPLVVRVVHSSFGLRM